MQPEMSSAVKSDARRGLILVVSSGWTWARSGGSSDHGGAACFAKRQAFNHVKDGRNEKDPKGAGCKHAADDGGAHDLTCHRTRAASGPKRDAAEDERKGGHKNGAQTQASAFQSGIDERLALLVFVLRKFHDENRVFRGEADEHDQADLGVDVVFDLHHVGGKK